MGEGEVRPPEYAQPQAHFRQWIILSQMVNGFTGRAVTNIRTLNWTNVISGYPLFDYYFWLKLTLISISIEARLPCQTIKQN